MAETLDLGLSDEEEKAFATYMEGGNEVLFGADLDLSSVESETDLDFSSVEAEGYEATPSLMTDTEELDFSSVEAEGYEPTPSLTPEPEYVAETSSMLSTPTTSRTPVSYEDQVNKDFFMSDNAQTSIGMFMKSRYGKSGIKQDGETREEYSERFFTKMRWMQNNIASTGRGLSWLNGADEKTKQNFGLLYTQFNDMPAFYEDGGGNAFDGVLDSVLSVVLDPTNVATLGIATGFKILGGRIAAQTLLKSAINSNKVRIAGAASVEGILGAMQAGNIQSLEMKADLRTEKDWNTILGMGALSAGTAGLINVGMFAHGLKQDTYKEKVAAKIAAKRDAFIKSGGDVSKGSAAKKAGQERVYDENVPLNEQLQDVATIFDDAYEINLNNAADVRTRITVQNLEDSKIIVAELADIIPALAPRVGERVTTALHRLFYSLHYADDALQKEIDDAIIDGGLKQGSRGMAFDEAMGRLNQELKDMDISPAQFGRIADVDVSTSGKVLNMQSQLSKIQDKISGGANKIANDAASVAKREDILNSSWAARVLNAGYGNLKKADRIRRAIMTSQPATMARNVISGTSAVSMHVASRLLRNSYAAMGDTAKALGGINGASPSFRGTYEGGVHIVKDAFSMIGDIFNNGQNREFVDLVLGDHSILHHQLLRTTQEAGINTLPKSVLMINSLNIAQDQFLRTGVFMNSVKRQMKDLQGIDDLTEHLARGNGIDTRIAEKAVEEALAITFANKPKQGLAKHFIEVVEALPFAPVIGTGALPFARFMANAMSFQFRYSPINALGAIQTGIAARSMKGKYLATGGKEGAGYQRLTEDAYRQFNDATVGTAAIAAAIWYRSDKQDTTTYDELLNDDGTTMGIGAVFPLPFYLMIGDLMVKGRDGTLGNVKSADIMQAATGYQASSSGVNYFLDNFMSVMTDNGIGVDGNVSSDKFSEAFGKYIGDIAGQYFTPAKVVRDVLAAFDEEQNLKRDANLTVSKGWDRTLDAFVNKATANLPYQLQEAYSSSQGRDGSALPAQQDAVRGEDQYNVAPALTQITGMKITPARTEVQNELLTKGFKPYLMLSPTGDKQADAMIRKHMPQFIDAIMVPIIKSQSYKGMSSTGQKNLLSEAKKKVIKFAKIRAQEDFGKARQKQGYSPSDRAKWGRIPRGQRKEVNERYMAKYGTTVEGDNAYAAGIQIAKSLPGL